MNATLYASVTDISDEGEVAVLDRVQAYGATGVTISFAYHQARDLTPHGANMLTLRRDGFYGEVPTDLFHGALVPPQLGGLDVGKLKEEADKRGLDVHAWVVACHNTTLGTQHPEAAIVNAIGSGGAPADLCPSNPEVQSYVVGLVRSSARLGVESVALESCHFGTFDHGYHHERTFISLSEFDRFVMGLCFCKWCMATIGNTGVDVNAARDSASAHIRRVLSLGSEGPRPAALEQIGAMSQDLADYASRRSVVVTSLVREAAEVAHGEGVALRFIDLSGATLGYADGQPPKSLAAEVAWRIGIDVRALASTPLDSYAALLYSRDPDRVRLDAEMYSNLLRGMCEFRGILRPGAPDCDDSSVLTQKVQAVRSLGGQVDFYHYGLYPFTVLDRIGEALDARCS